MRLNKNNHTVYIAKISARYSIINIEAVTLYILYRIQYMYRQHMLSRRLN